MRVLRRIFAMRAAHAGWPGPGSPSWLSLATWWTATVVPVSHSSHRRLRGGVADDRPPFLPQGYPAESCYQVLLALALAPGFEASPGAVIGGDLGHVAGGHLGDGGAVPGGQGLQHRCHGVPFQRAEVRDVLGEQVVVDDACVFGSVDPYDVVVVEVLEPGPVPGFSP